MSILQKRFDALVDKYGMLDTDSILLGFSGGADSSVLLFLLAKAQKRLGFDLKCVHVNHMIRSDEAYRDEAFCQKVCNSLGVELYIIREDIPRYAKEHSMGLEEAARDFRYKTFAELCQKHSIQTVATAHNATDNAETLIFNLCRGAGSKGAQAISPKRDNIIRPLLTCSKQLILDFAKENDIEFVTDSTNADTAYTRNYIRSNIIPSLERVNPCAIDAISRFTQSMKDESDYLERQAATYVDEDRLSVLSSLDQVILSRVIKQKFYNCAKADLDHQNIADVISMIQKNPSYASISLPGCIDAIVENGVFSFGNRFVACKCEDYKVTLHLGENYIEKSDALIYITQGTQKLNEDYINKKQNIYKLFISKSLVFDRIVGDMYARPRLDSDRYLINGVNKSVKKYMCDERFPKERRFNTPFLCDEQGIFWIPGMRERDGLMPKNTDTDNLINFYYFQKVKEV